MFNYPCDECSGTVIEKQIEHEHNIQGVRFVVPDARVGICDGCGAMYYDGRELKRWEQYKPQGTRPGDGEGDNHV